MKTSISNQQMKETFEAKTGITGQNMRDLGRITGLSANPNKPLTASQAKTMSKKLLKLAEEKGYGLKKGYSKTDDARARDIFTSAKQASQLEMQKDSGIDVNTANDPKEARASFWERLKGRWGANNSINNASAGAVISMQGSQALAPGTDPTQQKTNTQQPSPKQQPVNKMNTMDTRNQQKSPENQEKNMQASAEAEPGFGITNNSKNDNEPKVNLAP
tara:strand:- start:962 stop:1615 length:654 start_codon:yes stop_codon:yes gene_type:complete